MPSLINTPTREQRGSVTDSSRWAGFKPRADDIIVATYPKCGTTWTQRIVDLLVNQSPAPRQFMHASPWIDSTLFGPVEAMFDTIEAQTHRRCVKTHLPLSAFPVFEGAKVIHTARDGRDACISMHNHMLGIRREVFAAAAQAAPGGGPPPTPEDPREHFLQWMAQAEAYADGAPGDLPFCEFEESYWRRRREPWLLFVHYADLKADLAGEMQRISDFLGIETLQALLPELVQAATFETMKHQGEEMMPELAMAFDRGADRFINQGVNGRWKDFLTPEDLVRYDALIARKLSPAMAGWIAHGRLLAGDPRTLAD